MNRLVTELATRKVTQMNRGKKYKLKPATLDILVHQCCLRWHDVILPEFNNDATSWSVSPQFGELYFENHEVLSCFAPSVKLIRKMAVHAVQYIWAWPRGSGLR